MATVTINIDAHIEKHIHVMVIMRGVPGSGKSYLATKIFDKNPRASALFSTDDYWMRNSDGEYRYKPQLAGYAHKWNQDRARKAMESGRLVVIIDNTNINWTAIKPYVLLAKEFGYDVEFVEPNNKWSKDAVECSKRNTHGVPLETIQKMLANWQETSHIIEQMKNV